MIKKAINIGIAGYGTVGKGVVSLLQGKNTSLSQKAGAHLILKRVCDSILDDAGKVGMYSKNLEDIFMDPSIDIFVELIGGYQPAKRLILLALERGMDVVTANKNVLAKDFGEILSAAKKAKRRVYFEASVCAGVPVIAAINEGFCANKISSITGILNGTTNYILSEMLRADETLKKALSTAQKLGYAESDPSLDIKGWDSASKLAILSSIIFKSHISPGDIYVRGIENVEPIDLTLGGEFGYALKLFATMETRYKDNLKKNDDYGEFDVILNVSPGFVRQSHPLANVDGAYNAVYLSTDAAGEQMLYGPGAGSLPAASAVVSDIVYSARHILEASAQHMPFLELDGGRPVIADPGSLESSFYVRFTTVDKPGVLANIANILANYQISISSVVQKKGGVPNAVPIVMLTHKAKLGNIEKAVTDIDSLKIVRKKSVIYRILEL